MPPDSYLFFLPSLLEKRLIANNSDDYALVTYDRESVSDACRCVIQSIGIHFSSMPLSRKKKRVKFLMEFLAVALSLPIEDHEFMAIAVRIYRTWLLDSSIFRDPSRQNKYLRRIILQLSLPFAFHRPTESCDFAQFALVLEDILHDLRNFHIQRRGDLDPETWLVLCNSALGICDSLMTFNLSKYCAHGAVSRLREEGIEFMFSVMALGGSRDSDVWANFMQFCGDWSWNGDFVRIWGQYVVRMFTIVNARIFGINVGEEDFFIGGVYSAEKRIGTDMLSFIFQNFVSALGYSHTGEDPSAFLELTRAISELCKSAEALALAHSKFFANRYPAISFLKLFGPALTFAPVLPQLFDPGVAIGIETILHIVARFDDENCGNVMSRLIGYVGKRIDSAHQHSLEAFLQGANAVLAFRPCYSTYIARIAIEGITWCQFGSESLQFEQNMRGLFVSAVEILWAEPGIGVRIEQAFTHVWGRTQQLSTRFLLLLTCRNVWQRLLEVFED
jgi:hypothetical protein